MPPAVEGSPVFSGPAPLSSLAVAVVLLLVLVLLVTAYLAGRQPRAGERIAYWHQTLPGLSEHPDRFYAQVYQTLREGLALRHISLVGFGFGPRRLFEERSVFSHRPVYLSVRYKHLTYYLYASQTPAGFYISSWLYNRYVIGEAGRLAPSPLALRYFTRQTLFQYDAVLMFTESIHAIVMDVVDRYLSEQGLPPLQEDERRPILHAFYVGVGGTSAGEAPSLGAGLPTAAGKPTTAGTLTSGRSTLRGLLSQPPQSAPLAISPEEENAGVLAPDVTPAQDVKPGAGPPDKRKMVF